MKELPCFQDADGKKLISEICSQEHIDRTLLKDLCEVLHNFSGFGRKEGILTEIQDCIDRFMDRQKD